MVVVSGGVGDYLVDLGLEVRLVVNGAWVGAGAGGVSERGRAGRLMGEGGAGGGGERLAGVGRGGCGG